MGTSNNACKMEATFWGGYWMIIMVRFSPGQIIHAFETGQTAELLEEARKGQQIWDLYREWGEIQVREIKIRQRK